MTRAQEAEEMFIIKKELSRMKRRVSAFEEEQTKEGLENNVVEVNGTILEEEEEKGEGGGEGTDLTHSRDEEEDEMVEQQQLVVTAPTHVCREEAEVCLHESVSLSARVCVLVFLLCSCLCPCLPVYALVCVPVCMSPCLSVC